MAYTPPNNNAFNFNFTVSTYIPPNNNAFDFSFELGTLTFLSDSFAFNDSSEIINILIQSLSDTFALNDTLEDIIPIIGIIDSFGLNDLLSGYNTIFNQITDSFASNDLLDGKRIIIKLGSDIFAFNDVLVGKNIIFKELLSKFGFNYSLSSLDFIIYWSCRTKIPRLGYGGITYGDIIGYGEGEILDIIKYIFQVINESGVIVRQEDILVTDPENPDVIYWYDHNKNISDNTIWQQNLTFNVYQVDSKGIVSEVQTISTF